MPENSFRVTVAGYVPESEAQAELSACVADLERKWQLAKDFADAGQDDAKISEILRRHFNFNEQFVRADTYKINAINQEIGAYRYFVGNEGQRPVRLRGGLQTMILNYAPNFGTSPNKFVAAIARRYVRMQGITLLYVDDAIEFNEKLEARLFKKYNITRFDERFTVEKFGYDSFQAWVNGKRVYLTWNQLSYLRKLYGILGKVRKAEEHLEDAA